MPDGELERELKDRLETQKIVSVAGGGKHFLADRWQLDYSLSWARAEEDEPGAQYSTFLQEDVEFAPNVTPTPSIPRTSRPIRSNEDLDGYLLDGLSRDEQPHHGPGRRRRHQPGRAVRVRTAPRASSRSAPRSATRTRSGTTAQSSSSWTDDLLLSDVRDGFTSPAASSTASTTTPWPTRARPPSAPSPAACRAEPDPEGDLADYQAAERVLAGYAMAEVHLGPRLMLLPGVRDEHTDIDVHGLRGGLRRRGRLHRDAAADRRQLLRPAAPHGPPPLPHRRPVQPARRGHALPGAPELLRPHALRAGARGGPRDRARQSPARPHPLLELRPHVRALLRVGGPVCPRASSTSGSTTTSTCSRAGRSGRKDVFTVAPAPERRIRDDHRRRAGLPEPLEFPARALRRPRHLRQLHLHRLGSGVPRPAGRERDPARPVPPRRQRRPVLREERLLRPRRRSTSTASTSTRWARAPRRTSTTTTIRSST